MSVQIAGVLLDPYGEIASFAEIKFITTQGAGEVMTTAPATYKTSADGSYSMNIQFGVFIVQMRYNQSNGKFQQIKKVIVNSNTVATTLGELLLNNEPLTPPEIAYVEQLVAEAKEYRDESEVFAAASEASAQNSASSAAESAQSAIDAANSAALIAPIPLNGGVWASGQTYDFYNQYMIYNGEAYSPLPATVLPYTVGAVPDLGFVYQIKLNDHSLLANRDAVGAHDKIYRRAATVAQIESGAFTPTASDPVLLRVTDRGNEPFNVVVGGTPDGAGVIDAGNGNTAEIQILNGKPSLVGFGVVDDPTNIHQANNTFRIQQALNAGGKVQGIQSATYYLTKEITVGENTTYYAKQANHKQDSTWSYSGTSYQTVIILGDASSQTGNNLSRCNIVGAVVKEDFLGDPNVLPDVENSANYTSKASYGIRAQRTDDSYAKSCTVSGMETSGMGAEWSNNFLYERNKVTTCRIHGIANQGGTAVARSHKVIRNTVIGCGGMAFDINTAAGATVELTGNICRNVKQFYKCTDGSAYSANNECYSWLEQDDTFSAYGNAAGLNAVNDKLFNFARLTASGSQGADYQWSNITYISNNGALITVYDNTAYRISDSTISISTDKDAVMVGYASGATKVGFELSLTDSSVEFNTTAAANSASFGVISLGGWSDATINISNNKKLNLTGLSSQRIVIGLGSDIASTSGLAEMSGNNIESTGFDPQLGLFFKDSHNNKISNNTLKGVAIGSYETTEDFAINFKQYNNFSDTQFTIAIGSNNRIYDCLSVGRSGTTAPSGNKTPEFLGQRYYHWTLGDFYQSYGVGIADWRKLN